ncbi:glycosyltransferase [Flavobacterium sp. UBA6031]|uniref:glycosyltransferase n=1 Tax=Flavobacterium sp. UBA6031 TaxID=1946551 RepID=UPI0025C15B38|nr:radical SAM protein [Flavobacterium sp. UBA6031]
MRNLTLKHLTIKPITHCNLSCPYCDSRQEHFDLTRECVVGVDDWNRVFEEADDLGTEYLDISGGEPTLYPALDALIWMAKKKGWYVSINSTGTGINEKFVQKISEVCLDQVIISLMSIHGEKHDQIRGKKGSFQEAITSIQFLTRANIRVVIHFILSKQNYKELPKLIDFCKTWSVSSLALIHPENDHERQYILMQENHINDFKTNIIPTVLNSYNQYFSNRENDISNLKSLFSGHNAKADFTKGDYWESFEEIKEKCDKPNSFALIYSNGDVMPCNAIEYTKEPIVGNILRDSLKDIWHGLRYHEFRKCRTSYCLKCPVKRHTGVSINRVDNPPYTAAVIKTIPTILSQVRPFVKKPLLNTRILGERILNSERLNNVMDNGDKLTVLCITDWWFPKIGGLERSIEYLCNELINYCDIEVITKASNTSNMKFNFPVKQFTPDEFGNYYDELFEYIIKKDYSKTIIHFFGFSFNAPQAHADLIRKVSQNGFRSVLKIPTSGDVDKNIKNHYRHVKDNVDFYLSLNSSIEKELIENGIHFKSIVNIKNTVPTTRFMPASKLEYIATRQNLQLRTDVPLIGFAGRFVERKRINIVIEALNGIHIEMRPHLMLVGESDSTFCDSFKIHDIDSQYITVIQNQQNMIPIYHAMDAYISASVQEGMSNSCLEAMSFGLPLILSDIPGHTELIKKSGCGWLFEKDNVEELRAAIANFVESWRDRTIVEKGRLARKYAITEYDSRLWAGRYNIMYNALRVKKRII